MIATSFEERFRCTIIRGKAQKLIEDLLLTYADVIKSCEGKTKSEFEQKMDAELSRILFNIYDLSTLTDANKKTLDNHRTEIAMSLFGMGYFLNESLVVSPRTETLLKNRDLPQFFKDVVYHFQFPNGIDKKVTIVNNTDAHLKIRPFHFIIQLLDTALTQGLVLTKKEIAYYVLDSLKTLQGASTVEEVLEKIKSDRNNGVSRKVIYRNEDGSERAHSYCMQHISEQLNLLELSNLIIQDKVSQQTTEIRLNKSDPNALTNFLNESFQNLKFNIYDFQDTIENDFTAFQELWDIYYCESQDVLFDETSLASLRLPPVSEETDRETKESTSEIGKYGEDLVYEKEYERVSKFNSRLAKTKVKNVSSQRGLGYDIASIWADWAEESGKQPDAPIFIEVKTTKRVFESSFYKGKIKINDSFNLTRNEYLAAEMHNESFIIFRLYVSRESTYVTKIFDPVNQEGILCVPITYNYEFKSHDLCEQWN
jgi:hypothetical protein